MQDLVAAGGGAGDAAGVHGHFRAAGAEAHHFHRIALADFFGKLPFLFVRHAKGGALVQFLFDSFDDRGMAMPGHQRAEAQVVVDIFVAVDVVNAAAPFRPSRRGDKARSGDSYWLRQGGCVQGPLVCCGGFWRALLVGGDFLL